jgi:hypothetical protein
MTHTRVPADVDREDRLLAGLTARQLVVLTVAGLAAGFLVTLARRVLPLPLALAVAMPVAIAGLALALARVHGLSGDRFALAMLAYLRAPRHQVAAPEGVTRPPAWARASGDTQTPGTLRLPARDLYSNGVVDLGADGASLLCRASAVNFRLRTQEEQEALVAAFGRFLHSVAAPVQIVVRSERADLRAAITKLQHSAGGLPHPALEAAARQHAQYLQALAARRDVLRRELLVVLREPSPAADPEGVLPRRAEQAATLLAAAGITLTPLDHDRAADTLARAANPGGPARPAGLAAPGQTITRRRA